MDKKNLDFFQINIEDCKFYKRENRNIVPVLDEQINKKAKDKIESLKKNKIFLNSIPNTFLKNLDKIKLFHPNGDVDKADAIILEPENGAYHMRNKLNHLTGKSWTKFTKSWFIFDAIQSDIREEKQISQKANLNSSEHPATYSPTMMQEFIEFFTKEGEIVFDPFSGIGSTQVGAARARRIGLGIELNKKYTEIANLRLGPKSKVIQGDSKNLSEILKKNKITKFDFSISSPPYWNVLNRSTGGFKSKRLKSSLDVKYSNDLKNDIGNIQDYKMFLNSCKSIYFQMYNFLKKNGYIVIIVKNLKKDGTHYPLAWDLARILSKKYILKDEKIWCQDKQALSPFGYPFSWTSNIVHHYCLIFQK